MEPNEINIIKKSFIYALVLTIMTAFIGLILNDFKIVVGYLIGYLTSVITYYLLIQTVNMIIGKEKKHAVVFTILFSTVRYAIYGLVLYLGVVKYELNLITLFIGLMMIKITIYYIAFIKRGEV